MSKMTLQEWRARAGRLAAKFSERVAVAARGRQKRRAAKAILAADPIPVPDDPAELKRLIGEAHSRRL